jgi:Bacterial regulatory proteins, luxR family.
MKNIIWIFIMGIVCLLSCTRQQSHYNEIIDNAELVIYDNPDSALSLLESIEPIELKVDSIKAKYYYVMALAHDTQGNLMLSDSLISFSFDFYKNRDIKRSIGSATLLASYQYKIGESEAAIKMLDSLSRLENVADSLLIFPLSKNAYLWTKIYDESNRSIIRRLMSIDKDSTNQSLYKYWLYSDYLFDDKIDSALIVLNELIDNAVIERSSAKQFRYEYEKIGTLEEMGRYSESLSLADKLLTKAAGNSVEHYLHLWKSLALFNTGNMDEALQELAKADSCASAISDAEKGYYNSFTYFFNTILDYRNTGKLSMIRMAKINNRQKDCLLRTQAVQREAEQSAWEIENKRLILKAKNDRQIAISVIVVLAALLISGMLLWYALNRKRKELDALERNETLQKLVDESKALDNSATQNETLRKAMLQQLGIIKMFAETPTKQNRDMLRKISSIYGETDGNLVNWENIYNIIDNLYSGFYSQLNKRHGNILTNKEKQIIALMVAKFSTKEISVITAQTTATIYVRKSSIRKKLGIPEKEDILAFLYQKAKS